MPHPTEFRYWERIDQTWVRALRKTSRAIFGFDPAPSDEHARAFGQMYFDADPAAEAFVDEIYLKRGRAEGRAMIDGALDGGVASIDDPPESLVKLFEDLEQDPPWLDWSQLELGARAFRRYGVSVFRFAGAITLASYRENSVTQPLMLSGAYKGSSARHRFLETASFWIDVSEPEGLRPGAPGRAAILRVRMMHVFVRRRIEQDPAWQRDAWGVPISQADALLTLMGGSVAPGLALRILGFRPTRREVEAMMHFWRYVGHLMGVRPRWYPANVPEALQLGFVVLLKATNGATRDGERLARSYAEAFAPRETGPRAALEDGLHRAYTSLFLPPPIHRAYGLPSAGLWLALPLLAAGPRFALETLRRRSTSVDHWIDGRAREARQRWLTSQLQSKVAFEPPEPTRGS